MTKKERSDSALKQHFWTRERNAHNEAVITAMTDRDYDQARSLARPLGLNLHFFAELACERKILAQEFGSSREIAGEFDISHSDHAKIGVTLCVTELRSAAHSGSGAIKAAHLKRAKAIKDGLKLPSDAVRNKLRSASGSRLSSMIVPWLDESPKKKKS